LATAVVAEGRVGDEVETESGFTEEISKEIRDVFAEITRWSRPAAPGSGWKRVVA
jgi:hypothetical protein